MPWIFVVTVVAVGGIAVALQGQALGVMEQRLGTLEATFITYASGGIAIAAATLAVRGFDVGAARQLPWWAWTAGLLGLVIISSIAFGAPRIGLVGTLTVLVVAQFAAAAMIDHFGWLGAAVRQLDPAKGTGLALMLIGSWLTLR